ncbi:hypothetical protein JQ596_12360 [Bradyrhizobium manausense]|uniref:hypothetical protein n=1 Tax=Bradyrhizobium TaxID=374 RepID=UPI001BA9FCFA|nr:MULTISPECIES: hypothetical protein [Bradyrhizobium]MBR0826334.1 hypothetical protein [Bradyrhizobium manausense]UVO31660.1 hypothetical protein KUF59_14075 [Bradyrhizobium arachidis]
MSMRLTPPAGRIATLAAFAGLILTTSGLPSAAASGLSAPKATSGATASSDATDFSAARRRYYRPGPSAAGLAIMGAGMGMIAGAIAESRRQEYYENRYYYGGPGYYGGGPAYYGGGPYYGGPRYYQPY